MISANKLLEAELKQEPYDVTKWWSYLDQLQMNEAKFKDVCRAFEGALSHLPGSYKLWYRYIDVRRKRARGRQLGDARYSKANRVFDRALTFLHKMPRLWIDYLTFLYPQCNLQNFRRTLNMAIQALPISQHARIWSHVFELISNDGDFVDDGINFYERFLKLQPSKREDYIEYLMKHSRHSLACLQIYYMLRDPQFLSLKSKSKHDYWLMLCEIIRGNAENLGLAQYGLDPEMIIRQGLKKYTDQSGQLWCTLCDYFIKLGRFETAMSVYMEAMKAVVTVRDFSTIFDACTQFQETLLSAKIEVLGDIADEAPQQNVDDGFAILDGKIDIEVDLLLARLDYILEQRPFLLNSVMLRQNPNNIPEWLKRVSLFKAKVNDQNAEEIQEEIVKVYKHALDTIDYTRSFVGDPEVIFIDAAKYFEELERRSHSYELFETGMKTEFSNPQSLVDIICEYCEMLIRDNNLTKAKQVLQRCFHKKKNARQTENELRAKQSKSARTIGNSDVRDQMEDFPREVKHSVTLWTLYADLEITLGTVKTVKAVYAQMMHLKVMTPPSILHYASFLEEQDLFEEAFSVYERGVSMFSWPESAEIWTIYLHKFEARYEGSKLDRARELFQEALVECPPDLMKSYVLMYAYYEEQYGYLSNCMQIYADYSPKLPLKDRFDVVIIYLQKTLKYFGLLRARSIYEKAIETAYETVASMKHKDGFEQVCKLCMYYAQMEKGVGEVERSRAIFQHGSQFADPKSAGFLWDSWYQLELEHGNATTFKEMLRVKRSASAQFGVDETEGFVRGSTEQTETVEEDQPVEHVEVSPPSPKKQKIVDDSLEIDVEQLNIPATVFGGIK